jgi:hypothetical protein
MDMTAFPDGAVTGFAVTGDGRVFASIYLDVADSQQTVRRGLYEIRTRTGDVTAHWLQVNGTESSHPLQGSAQPGTFWKLCGADGKTLVVNMAKSGDLASGQDRELNRTANFCVDTPAEITLRPSAGPRV